MSFGGGGGSAAPPPPPPPPPPANAGNNPFLAMLQQMKADQGAPSPPAGPQLATQTPPVSFSVGNPQGPIGRWGNSGMMDGRGMSGPPPSPSNDNAPTGPRLVVGDAGAPLTPLQLQVRRLTGLV